MTRYFDDKGRPVDEEKVALAWLGRNRERALTMLRGQAGVERPSVPTERFPRVPKLEAGGRVRFVDAGTQEPNED